MIDEHNQGGYDAGYINFTSDVDIYRFEPQVAGTVEISVIPDWRRGFGLIPVASLHVLEPDSHANSREDGLDRDGSLHPAGVIRFTCEVSVGAIYYLAVAAKEQASAGRYSVQIQPIGANALHRTKNVDELH